MYKKNKLFENETMIMVKLCFENSLHELPANGATEKTVGKTKVIK